jgi:hypothetical protein
VDCVPPHGVRGPGRFYRGDGGGVVRLLSGPTRRGGVPQLGQAMWPSGLDSSASARESGAGEQSWGGGSACCGKMEQGEGAAEASTVPPCCPHATAWNRKKKAGQSRERERTKQRERDAPAEGAWLSGRAAGSSPGAARSSPVRRRARHAAARQLRAAEGVEGEDGGGDSREKARAISLSLSPPIS